jgi:hypothetical protein
MITEFNIAIVYSLVIPFITDEGVKKGIYIQWVIIGFIIFTILVNIGSVAFNLVRFIYNFIQKYNDDSIEEVPSLPSDLNISTSKIMHATELDFYYKVKRRLVSNK